MLATIWHTIALYPFLNLLLLFYKLLGNFGLAIIAVTFASKILLLPLSLASMKAAKKQKELMPDLKAIQEKYKDDKRKAAEEQAKLYKEKGIHPASGCLLQIVQLFFLIALYSAFNTILQAINPEALTNLNKLLYNAYLYLSEPIKPAFLYLNLTKPDPYYILPALTGVTQFIFSKMSMSSMQKEGKLAEQTVDKKDDVAYNMQQQMLYMMPVLTVIISLKLPSGLVFYWFLSTLLSLIQQYFAAKKGFGVAF